VSSGFLVAFDKHWNLALRDVDEEFTRKRSRKTWHPHHHHVVGDAPQLLQRSRPKLLPQDLPVEVRNGASVLRIVQIRGKFEVCQRHVAQVLLRGEHVVMVAKAAA
jgi:small nuclear ribonucleoprotein (snRNP)-like protein